MTAELLLWIGANTAYTCLLPAPEFWLRDPGDAVPYEGALIMVEEGERAFFDTAARRVILIRPWSGADLRDRSVLLHELVHYVQWANRHWACTGEGEWEAYKLQEAWLNEHGLNAEFDWLAIYFLSRCPDDHHP